MSDSPFQDPRMQEIQRARPSLIRRWRQWRYHRETRRLIREWNQNAGRLMVLPPSHASVLWVCERCGWSASVEMPGFAGAFAANGVHCHWEYPGGYPCGPLVGELQDPTAATAAGPGQEVK